MNDVHFSVFINAIREHVAERPPWERNQQEAAHGSLLPFFSGTVVRIRDHLHHAIIDERNRRHGNILRGQLHLRRRVPRVRTIGGAGCDVGAIRRHRRARSENTSLFLPVVHREATRTHHQVQIASLKFARRAVASAVLRLMRS